MAKVPTPFVLPLIVPPAPPARVVTAPVALFMVRIRLLPESAMYALLALSTATPIGMLNVAAVLTPFPAPL